MYRQQRGDDVAYTLLSFVFPLGAMTYGLWRLLGAWFVIVLIAGIAAAAYG